MNTKHPHIPGAPSEEILATIQHMIAGVVPNHIDPDGRRLSIDLVKRLGPEVEAFAQEHGILVTQHAVLALLAGTCVMRGKVSRLDARSVDVELDEEDLERLQAGSAPPEAFGEEKQISISAGMQVAINTRAIAQSLAPLFRRYVESALRSGGHLPDPSRN